MSDERWDWEFARRQTEASLRATTPLQRLEWLDGAVEFAAAYAGKAQEPPTAMS